MSSKMIKNEKIENFINLSELHFGSTPEQDFSFFIIENGAKHSPLVLGVWVTEGRILALQRKFGGLSFVRFCSKKIRITIYI